MLEIKRSVITGKLIGDFGLRSVAEWPCWFTSRSESHRSCWVIWDFASRGHCL